MGMHADAEVFYGLILGGEEEGFPIRPPEWAGDSLDSWHMENGNYDYEPDRDAKFEDLGEWEDYLLAQSGLGHGVDHKNESDDERKARWHRERELRDSWPCEVTTYGADGFTSYAVAVKESMTKVPDYGHAKLTTTEVDPRWNGQIRAFLEKLGYRDEDIDNADIGWFATAQYG